MPSRRNRFWRIFVTAASLILLFGDASCRRPEESTARIPNGDPFRAAASAVEDDAELPYIEASRPILEAITKQDYGRLFELTSSHALKTVNPEQFAPMVDAEGNSIPTSPVLNMTKEQFLESMKRMESELGTPCKTIDLYVQTIDADELAGKGDAIGAMLNIGGMSPEIPFEIRKASIRAQLGVRVAEKYVKEWAEIMEASEEDVRSGKAFVGHEEDFDSGDGPYLNVKFVLVEDEGQLKLGYFEFMPPSMLD